MTLSELAVTVGLLCVLGLVARRFGISAIPAYLLAGLLLGPNEPKVLTLIQPSEVTDSMPTRAPLMFARRIASRRSTVRSSW